MTGGKEAYIDFIIANPKQEVATIWHGADVLAVIRLEKWRKLLYLHQENEL
jgi:hypothetical protein